MKLVLSPAEVERLAGRFKILSEPSRLQILSALCDRERTVNEICDRTGLSQANASKHLQLLRHAGVVACRRVGSCRYYRVVDADLLSLCVQSRASLCESDGGAASGAPDRESEPPADASS